MFVVEFEDELKGVLKKLLKRDKQKYEQILKKIYEITASDFETIDHYKNLRHDLSNYKRVHIGENFVLTFRVFKTERIVRFIRFRHRDDVYK